MSREEIAQEKAGIFKAGAAAVIGDTDPDIASLLVRHAQQAAAEPVVAVRERYAPSAVALGASGTRLHDAA